jgi:hypothetical protein
MRSNLLYLGSKHTLGRLLSSVYVQNANRARIIKIRETCILKGTVARDFWPLVFFMNQPHMGP